MATATLATAAGAAAIYYYSKWGTPWGRRTLDEFAESDENAGIAFRRRVDVRLVRAPSTWFEALATLMETLRFTYSETLGKWPIGDLAFGINYLLRRQGHLHVASVFAGEGCSQLKGLDVANDLKELLRLLIICLHFSKKPFPQFLEATGYSQEHVLLQESKAALLKPAFVVLVDSSSNSLLLIIRGTHSIKDTLTAVTGAVVPFHHTILDDGGVQSLVLGYAHCGMVAAARWIAQLATPCLLESLKNNPSYQIKIVGHSLGGGTAALLTYILRERKELAAARCISFAPAACMTWELAESGKLFVTSVVNGSDLVPTFSAASVDDLRAEVTSSAWITDFREQIERTRILRTVFRSATAVSSRLSSIATLSRARTGVANAGAIWRPVSNGTQVVMKQAQSVAMAVVRTRPSLSGWSCMGPRRRTVAAVQSSVIVDGAAEPMVVDDGGGGEKAAEEMEMDMAAPPRMPPPGEEEEEEQEQEQEQEQQEQYLWQELEEELKRHKEESRLGREAEEKAAIEITKEEEGVMAEASEMGTDIVAPGTDAGGSGADSGAAGNSDLSRFYPPGRIIHMVSPLVVVSEEEDGDGDGEGGGGDGDFGRRCGGGIGVFETKRSLYGRVRLSRTMVLDHYMPTYKKTMEELIQELEKEIQH